MTWKEKQTITILLSVLGALSAVLLVVLAIRYRENRPALTDTDGSTDSGAVSGPAADPSALTGMTCFNGSATLNFTVDEKGAWSWADGPDFPLDSTIPASMAALAADLRFQQTLTSPDPLDTYGLDDPSAVLTLTTGTGEKRLAFGKATTDGTSRYLMLDDDESTLYIIDGALYEAMQTPIYDMMALPELPDLSEANLRSLTIYGPPEEASGDGEEEPEAPVPAAVVTARQGEGGGAALWFSESLNVTTNSALLELLADLRGLTVKRCVDYRPSEEAASLCGFDEPEAVLEIEYGAAEEPLVLTIGAKQPAGEGRYARLSGEDDTTIYLLEEERVDSLLQIAANGLNG